MIRRLLLLLPSALSLLLRVAVCVLWVRSHLVYEQVGRITPDQGADIIRSASGRLHFARHSYWDHTFSLGGRWEHHAGVQAPDNWPQYVYQRPADEAFGFARYVGTAYTWPPGIPGEGIGFLIARLVGQSLWRRVCFQKYVPAPGRALPPCLW